VYTVLSFMIVFEIPGLPHPIAAPRVAYSRLHRRARALPYTYSLEPYSNVRRRSPRPPASPTRREPRLSRQLTTRAQARRRTHPHTTPLLSTSNSAPSPTASLQTSGTTPQSSLQYSRRSEMIDLGLAFACTDRYARVPICRKPTSVSGVACLYHVPCLPTHATYPHVRSSH
jgi:hypothetical protein